eukprot:1734435-Rhodomonas_salina.1
MHLLYPSTALYDEQESATFFVRKTALLLQLQGLQAFVQRRRINLTEERVRELFEFISSDHMYHGCDTDHAIAIDKTAWVSALHPVNAVVGQAVQDRDSRNALSGSALFGNDLSATKTKKE